MRACVEKVDVLGWTKSIDKLFVKYIQQKQEQHDEVENITSSQLMELDDTKYKQLKGK